MYIIVENDIIQGLYDSVEIPDNAIIISNGFQIRAGDNVNRYNEDWTRKTLQQLVDEKIIPETDTEYVNYKINEYQSYLSQTDWYAIRYADTGEEIPTEIKLERQNAREQISLLRVQLPTQTAETTE